MNRERVLSLAKRVLGFAGSLRTAPREEGAKDALKELIADAHRNWVAANGDKTFRLDYELSKDSVVLDVGGFEGQWASDIFSMYLCNIHVFEPVRAYYESIARRFARNINIHIHPFGLGGAPRSENITVAGDASSIVRAASEAVEPIEIVAAAPFLDSHFPSAIDLIKINIEGAEYELLEHLIERRTIERIRNIQVQFHEFVPNALERMTRIQQELRKTHTLTFQYPFIWENWCMKRGP